MTVRAAVQGPLPTDTQMDAAMERAAQAHARSLIARLHASQGLFAELSALPMPSDLRLHLIDERRANDRLLQAVAAEMGQRAPFKRALMLESNDAELSPVDGGALHGGSSIDVMPSTVSATTTEVPHISHGVVRSSNRVGRVESQAGGVD